MYFYTLLGIHIFLIFLWFYLKYKHDWSKTRVNTDRFFQEQHEKLNAKKAFEHFMGRIDPYKDVKSAIDQLDRHFNDKYRNQYSRSMYIGTGMEPNITPQPDLEEVIINTSLNPNLKHIKNGKR